MSRRPTSTRVALAAVVLLVLIYLLPVGLLSTAAQDRTGSSAIDQTDARGGGTLIINEVDADQVSSDINEFIELYDGGAGNTPLDGYVVVLYNGSNDLSYAAFDLDGFATNSGGYFTLGNTAVPGVDLVFANGILQNGPDAVAIFAANAANFPNGSAITVANIQDALVYSTTTTIDAGLLVLLNAGQAQVNENATGSSTAVSMQRIPNGSGGGRNTDAYQLSVPTPDGPNLVPSSASLSLSGRALDAQGNPIRGAGITVEGGDLTQPRLALSSSFGHFSFDGLSRGTYMVTIRSRRHTFAAPMRMVTLSDDVANVDFIAEPWE